MEGRYWGDGIGSWSKRPRTGDRLEGLLDDGRRLGQLSTTRKPLEHAGKATRAPRLLRLLIVSGRRRHGLLDCRVLHGRVA